MPPHHRAIIIEPGYEATLAHIVLPAVAGQSVFT